MGFLPISEDEPPLSQQGYHKWRSPETSQNLQSRKDHGSQAEPYQVYGFDLSRQDQLKKPNTATVEDDTESITDTVSVVFSEGSSQSSNTSYSSSDSEAHDFDNSNVQQQCQSEPSQDVHDELLTGLRNQSQTANEAILGWQRRNSSFTGLDQISLTELKHDIQQDISRSQPQQSGLLRARSRRSGSTSDAPPALRRDTDSADCFVHLLIAFAAKLITAFWPQSACPPRSSTCFNGAGVLPLQVFIHETLRRSKTSYSTLQVALFYLVLLKDNLPQCDFTKAQSNSNSSDASACRAMQCGRRMFLAALMLASKYLQDRNYSTRAWSKISGLRIPEINENEREYLKRIDYNLHMTRETFDNWSRIVINLSKLTPLSKDIDAKGDMFRRPGTGSDSILANMVLESSLPRTPTDNGTYTRQWWNELLKRLVPEVVTDSDKAESFLRDYVPNVDMELPTTATNSPTASSSRSSDSLSSTANATDSFEAGMLPRLGLSATPEMSQSTAQSPAYFAQAPTKPQLGNLPTPQTTPRVPLAGAWVTNNPHCFRPRLHCSASTSALRNLAQPCSKFANLDRCPPPPKRPHSLHLPPSRSLIRPAASNQPSCLSQSSTPPTISPTSSVFSEAPRSRSSSISSNSSWSSTTKSVPTSNPLQFSSPLSRVSSMPEQPSGSMETSKGSSHDEEFRKHVAMLSHVRAMQDVISKSRSGNLVNGAQRSFVAAHDEGYFSGEDAMHQFASGWLGKLDEETAAEALLALGTKPSSQPSASEQSQQIPARGHKRTISKTEDITQQRVREILNVGRDVGPQRNQENMRPSTHLQQEGKQLQMPSKKWAPAKQPLPVPTQSKRVALSCALQKPSSASDQAAYYLREDLMLA